MDAAEVAKNPLRVGLSMEATVDIRQLDGRMLADAPRTEPLVQTTVYAALNQGANDEVRRIVAANMGRP